MDIITTISTSITLAKRLRDISKNIEDAEFRNLLADLSSELADLKLEAASLKERIAELQEENVLLKQTAGPADERPSGRKWAATNSKAITVSTARRAGILNARNLQPLASMLIFVSALYARHHWVWANNSFKPKPLRGSAYFRR